ncbi:hypothetical protein JXA88_18590, partial [Candidatus Fermentibacteria bacterium]|nr:hypothetical protein [Candidatus Fermentibacteria bacterium]
PIASIGAGSFPLGYTDDSPYEESDMAFYLVVPVDVDGNANPDGVRKGAYRYTMSLTVSD